jgi:hypothetical protein
MELDVMKWEFNSLTIGKNSEVDGAILAGKYNAVISFLKGILHLVPIQTNPTKLSALSLERHIA